MNKLTLTVVIVSGCGSDEGRARSMVDPALTAGAKEHRFHGAVDWEFKYEKEKHEPRTAKNEGPRR